MYTENRRRNMDAARDGNDIQAKGAAMNIDLERYLDDIESRLNDEQECRVRANWLAWIRHENASGPCRVPPRRPAPSSLEWPHVNINDAIADDTLCVYRELEGVNAALTDGRPTILRVRANYGVGNIATAFGARSFIMPHETDTLPNVRSMDADAVAALIGSALPDHEAGNFAAIRRFARNYKKLREKYPKIAKYIRVEQPDLQGPMDNLELIMGSSGMFYALYDDGKTVHVLLDMITNAIEAFMDDWLAFFPENRAFANYFTQVEEGNICIRDDSAMNLSPEMFSEFIAPYDGRLLRKYGGIVHFCGRGDHYIEKLAGLEGLTGVNMSQPHLNDMEKIYACTIDRGIHLCIMADSEVPAPVGHDTRNLIFL